jgi:hypothetical protein
MNFLPSWRTISFWRTPNHVLNYSSYWIECWVTNWDNCRSQRPWPILKCRISVCAEVVTKNLGRVSLRTEKLTQHQEWERQVLRVWLLFSSYRIKVLLFRRMQKVMQIIPTSVVFFFVLSFCRISSVHLLQEHCILPLVLDISCTIFRTIFVLSPLPDFIPYGIGLSVSSSVYY